MGSLVRSRGADWRIKAYHGSAAVLEAVETDGGGGGGPATKPAPLNDTPLTLEILTEA